MKYMRYLIILMMAIIMSSFTQNNTEQPEEVELVDISHYCVNAKVDESTQKMLDVALANLFDENGNKKLLFENAQRISQKGYAIGDYLMGWCFEGGEGTSFDMENSVVYFLKAAKAATPFVWAYRSLGHHYGGGYGVEEDAKEALFWFQKGAESIQFKEYKADCLYYIGQFNQLGKGIPQNYSEAARFFQMAANLSSGQAAGQLGCLYLFGQGVEMDISKSFYWMEKAATLGDPTMQYLVGRAYIEGGTPYGYQLSVNREKGIRYLTQAAMSGDVDAMILLNKLNNR